MLICDICIEHQLKKKKAQWDVTEEMHWRYCVTDINALMMNW